MQELEQQKMDSIRAIADANMKVSEAKNLLFKLQEQETEYLKAREEKAMDRIQKVVEDSAELLREANQNYEQIKELGVGVSEFGQNLLKFQADLTQLFTEFQQRNEEWERQIGKQQDDIEEAKKHLKIEKLQIKHEHDSLQSARKKLAEDQRKLASEQGTLERTINRLKENRI